MRQFDLLSFHNRCHVVKEIIVLLDNLKKCRLSGMAETSHKHGLFGRSVPKETPEKKMGPLALLAGLGNMDALRDAIVAPIQQALAVAQSIDTRLAAIEARLTAMEERNGGSDRIDARLDDSGSAGNHDGSGD